MQFCAAPFTIASSTPHVLQVLCSSGLLDVGVIEGSIIGGIAFLTMPLLSVSLPVCYLHALNTTLSIRKLHPSNNVGSTVQKAAPVLESTIRLFTDL